MDEQYIIDLYNQLGGEGKFGAFEDFKDLIKSDPSYQKDFYNAFGESTLGAFEDFKSLVSAPTTPTKQPMAQEQQPVKKKEDLESSWFGGDGTSESEPSGTKQEPYNPNAFLEEYTKSQSPVIYEAPKTPLAYREGSYPDLKNRIAAIDSKMEKASTYDKINLFLEKSDLQSKIKEIESSPVREYSEDDFLFGKPVDITAPKFIEENLNALTARDLSQFGTEGAKERLDYYFKDAGFKVEKGYGNSLEITSPTGETHTLNTIYPSSKSLNDLKDFIRINTYNNPEIAKKEYLYEKENKKFRTKEEVNNEIKNISEQEKKFNDEYKQYLNMQKDIEDIKKDLKRFEDFNEQNTPKYIQTAAYLKEKEQEFIDYQSSMVNKAESLKEQSTQLNKAVGKYTEMQSTQGDWGGTLYRSITNTVANNFSQFLRLTTSKSIDIAPLSYLYPDEETRNAIFQEKLKERGLADEVNRTGTISIKDKKEIEAEMRDDLKKAAISGKVGDTKLNNVLTIDGIREAIKQTLNAPIETTEEYKQKLEKEGSFITRGLIGLAGSLPAMVGGPALRYINMYLMTTDAAMQEMDNDPDFADISENEKQLVAMPMGVIGAALEEIGFKNLKLGKSITSNIVKSVIGRVPVGATASQIRRTTLDVVTEMGIRGTTAFAGGILSEAETGAAQQINEYLTKDIYNAMKGKKMFDNPAFLSTEYLYDIYDASRTEAVGAGVMSVPYSISAAFQKDGFQGLDDATFKIFEDLAKDNDSRKFFVTSLKNKINQGEITPNQSKKLLEAYDQSSGMIAQVPDEIIDPNDRKIAMDLMAERKRLQNKIEGKDPALSKPIQDKIDKINEQLNTLTQDAIQKQAAGEVSLQPEAEPSKEMEAGGPEAGPEAAPKQGVLSPEESKRKEELTTALQNVVKGTVTIGEQLLEKEEAQAELDALLQKEQATPEGLGAQLEIAEKEGQETAQKTTTDIITSAPLNIKGGVIITDSNGNDVVVNDNEQIAAKLYDDAMATPEDQRTPNQNDIIEKVQRIISQVAADTEVTPVAAPVQPAETFTEQDKARQQELTDALAKADKRRKNITVGETVMPKADVKAELDALNQKELSSQQPTVEAAPVTETAPALSNVERTAKALEGKDNTDNTESIKITEIFGLTNEAKSKGPWKRDKVHQFISEEYHQAKADGSNPQLVEAVEKLLGKEAAPVTEVAPVAPTETAPVQALTPEQEADKLEQMMLAKMGEPKVETAPEVETELEPTTLTGVRYSDIVVGDKYLEDILSDNNLSEDEKQQVREIFRRGIYYFKFDKNSEQKFQEKFANPEDITDIVDVLTTISAAQESAFDYYNTNNYENVIDYINYIINNQNDYSIKVVNAVKEIKGKLDNPISSTNRLYAIDIMKELGIKSESTTKEKTSTKTLSDTVRSLKIKGPGGLQSNILGVPIAIWNAAMDTVAKAIDAGVALSSAVQKGYDYIKDKHKSINKERFEKKLLSSMYLDAIKTARANGISEEGIKTFLKRKGLDDAKAEALLKEEKGAGKKITVSEKTLPGYDKLMNRIAGVIDRSRKRGLTDEKIMENVINNVEANSPEYANATDQQREQIIRDIRAMFGKKEKKAPTAQKILGKPKPETQTKTVNALRKEFWTAWNKSAREAKADLNKKRKMLTAAIKDMVKKGSISVRQAKALINRVNSVNLDNPVMVERLLTYAENVFNDADYDTRVQEVRKLQEQVKKVNHVSMKDTVREFTSINPERIPAEKLLEYIQALDDMNTRTPLYEKMNNMFDEVMSYKSESKEFDAIKTFQALIDKLESIAINQVKSVEDYVALIRDINAFKRKAYQLLQNGAITQEQYDEAIENVGKDQAAVEKKYEKEITALKKGLVQEIIGLKPKVHPDFTPEEAALINKYLELSEADLESLSPEDLYILNDLLNNIKEDVQLDYYRMSDIVSKAYTNSGSKQLSTQLGNANFNMSSEQGKKKLSEYESAFWEGLLGLGRATSGALQKFVVSPFVKAIGSYENFLRTGYNEFLKMKEKYNMKEYNMHRLGVLTTYLQEYMAQFDPKNKNIKDIGKRDWFKEILASTNMRDDYSSGKPSLLKSLGRKKPQIEIIKKIWESLPKDANGNVDPEAVYNSFMNNDGKYFAKNEKLFFDAVMNWKQKNLTSKQKAANELRGNPFKEIPFHMMRVRLDRGIQQIAPKVSGANGLVSIQAGTGKERASEKIGAIETNFEQLFTAGLEQTGRDFYLASALKDINNTLGAARKNLTDKDMPLLKTISQTLSEALEFEFEKSSSNWVSNTLLAAKAAEAIFDPERTLRETIAALFSYPIRAKNIKGYKDLFGKVGQMKELLEFTESPLRLRDNINKAIDINDGKIEPKGKLEKLTEYLSGLAERTMMVTSWMPNFRDEFKNITGAAFDMEKFKSSKAYREKYGKAIKEAASVADAQTEKVVGSTTKAGQRREIRLLPKAIANLVGLEGTVNKSTTGGKIVSFFNNYPYREITEFLNGFKEAAEVYKTQGISGASRQLLKPLGISMNLAIYGFLATASYGLMLMLLGGEDDEEEGEKILDNLFTLKGFSQDLAGDAVSLAASRYAVGGKAMLQLAATIGVMSTSDKEQKAIITKALKNSIYLEPLPTEKAIGFGGRKEIANSLGLYVPQFVIAVDRYSDIMKATGEISELYKKVKESGVSGLTKDEKARALTLSTLVTSTQIALNAFGSSIPMYGKVKIYIRGIKKDAGVDNLKAPTERQKAYSNYKSESEFMEKDPEGYLKAIEKGGKLYEYKKNQKEKEAEKNANEPLTDSQIEKLKKENPTKWREEYGPGTDYYEEQRTPEGIEKRAEQRRVKAEAARIKKQNELEEKREAARKRREELGY